MTRSALVTGAAGFVGTRLVAALRAAGWRVVGLAQTVDGIPASDPGTEWLAGDARDVGHLRAALDLARPDAVFHLAGVSFVPAAAADPGYAADVNTVAAARLVGLIAERRRAGTLD
ncbi:MAG TPA: NAD-dependent epimerase/dehydratase family protein, partial [Gemmatirosa sp.]